MKKRLIGAFLTFIIASLMIPSICVCEEMSNHELMQELKALKEKIRILEEKLVSQEKEEIKKEPEQEGDKFHGGAEGQLGLPERIRRIEENLEQKQDYSAQIN